MPDRPVDGPAALGYLLVAVLHGDLVTEEFRRLGGGMLDQCFLLAQFQLEVFSQDPGQARFDLLGLSFRSGKPEQMVIGISNVTQPPVSRVLRIQARQQALPLAQFPYFPAVTALAGTSDRRRHPCVFRIGYPALSPGVLRYQDSLDKIVQPVQVDIGQDRGYHPALRCPAERGAPYPVFQVSGLKHVAHKPEEPVIVYALRDYSDHTLLVETPETIGEVSLDEPCCPGPSFCHVPQCGVASQAWTETVRRIGELRLVVRLKQQADHLAEQFIRPCRHAERAGLPVLFRDVYPPPR